MKKILFLIMLLFAVSAYGQSDDVKFIVEWSLAKDAAFLNSPSEQSATRLKSLESIKDETKKELLKSYEELDLVMRTDPKNTVLIKDINDDIKLKKDKYLKAKSDYDEFVKNINEKADEFVNNINDKATTFQFMSDLTQQIYSGE